MSKQKSNQTILAEELGTGDDLGLERIICKQCQLPKSKTYDFYVSNKSTCKACSIKRSRKRNVDTYSHYIWSLAKYRAKEKGLEFTITPNDVIIPEICPVLLVPLVVGTTHANKSNAPTIDRIDNSKGYTPDNICVISYRANSLKNNATPEELSRVLAYMQGQLIF